MKQRARYALVGIGAAILSAWLLGGAGQVPRVFPDTGSYQAVARQIRSYTWPDTSLRLPVYPLYLLMFGIDPASPAIIYGNILLAACSAVMLYFLLNQLFAMPWITMGVVLFLFSDYGVVSYERGLLTESVAPALIIFSLWATAYSAIQLRNGKIRGWHLLLVLLSDSLLLYGRPQFVAVPFAVKGFLFLHRQVFSVAERGRMLRFVGIGVCTDILLVAVLLGYNFAVNGRPQISDIGKVNVFGKALQAGMLDRVPGQVGEAAVGETVRAYRESGRSKDPWIVIQVLTRNLSPKVENVFRYIGETNRYLIMSPGGAATYVRYAVSTFPAVVVSPRSYAEIPAPSLRDNVLFAGFISVFREVNGLGLWGVVFAVGMYALLVRMSPFKAVLWGLVLVPVLVLLSVNTFFGYEDFYRLRVPVAPLISLFVLSPVLFLREYFKRFTF